MDSLKPSALEPKPGDQQYDKSTVKLDVCTTCVKEPTGNFKTVGQYEQRYP